MHHRDLASIEKRLRGDGSVAFRVVWRDPIQPGKQSMTFDDQRQAEQRLRSAAGAAAERQTLRMVTGTVNGSVSKMDCTASLTALLGTRITTSFPLSGASLHDDDKTMTFSSSASRRSTRSACCSSARCTSALDGSSSQATPDGTSPDLGRTTNFPYPYQAAARKTTTSTTPAAVHRRARRTGRPSVRARPLLDIASPVPVQSLRSDSDRRKGMRGLRVCDTAWHDSPAAAPGSANGSRPSTSTDGEPLKPQTSASA